MLGSRIRKHRTEIRRIQSASWFARELNDEILGNIYYRPEIIHFNGFDIAFERPFQSVLKVVSDAVENYYGWPGDSEWY